MPSVSAQYSIVLRMEIDHQPGMLGLVATAIGEAGGSIGSVDLVAIEDGHTLRDITVETAGEEHAARIGEAAGAVDGARLVEITDRTFQMHVGGKIEQRNKLPVRTRDDLSMAYTPGVARVCTAIARDRDKAFQYTIKRNTVAVVSDGSAVLGLGDIGPEAAMPVMEGKAVLFKEFGGVDAFPICLVDQGSRADHPDGDQHRARLRRDQPRGHQRAALLRDRGAPEGRPRHPGLPRRPARHGRRHARRADERGQAHRQGAQGPARADRRARRGGNRRGQDPAPCGRDQHRRLRQPRRGQHRPRRLRGRLDAARQALVRRGDQPGEARRRPSRRDRGRRPLRRPLGRARDAAGGAEADEPRRDGLRDGQPEPGDHAGGGAAVRTDHRHRPQRLPEPDQQRPLLSRASSAALSTSGRGTSPRR